MPDQELEIWKTPTVQELIAIVDAQDSDTNLQRLGAMDVFNMSVNRTPPPHWIKKHPIVNIKIGEQNGQNIMAPLEYIPIEKHRLLGKMFFGWVGEEILREGVAFQSVYVVVRLHYTHPITKERMFHDGIGAVDAQTKKGASAADLANINPGAIQKGFPAAASYAFNNAYKKFGKLFGQDLQKDAQQFNEATTMYMKDVPEFKMKPKTEQNAAGNNTAQ